MRIIKNVGGDIGSAFRAICNEMINIESSCEQYGANGKLDTPNAGYPSFNLASGQIIVKASGGYIFVSVRENITSFIDRLIHCMNTYYNTEHLRKYQSAGRAALHTVTKVKCCTTLTSHNEHGSNIIRLITAKDGSFHDNGARFIWRVVPIHQLYFDITNSRMPYAFYHHALSIFYDAEDVTAPLPHWTYVTTFRKSMFANFANIITEQVKISEFLPIAFELSPFWSKYMNRAENTLYRNIIQQVYHNTLNNLTLNNVKYGGDYICYTCHTVLYGENYVLYKKLNSDVVNGIALCPLCLHTHANPIEKQYMYLFRVQFPKTIQEMIAKSIHSANKKDILYECMKGMYWANDNNHDKLAFVGDKYVGVTNMDAFLMSPSKNMLGRRAFLLVM